MGTHSKSWRPLVLGLAAAVCSASLAWAQAPTLAERIALCSSCHGEDGNSRMPNIPSIAGQPEFFVLNQLFLMREGVRKVEQMAPFVKELKDADLDGLAKHYSKLPAKVSEEKIDPDLVKRGAELNTAKRCGSCHMPNFAGSDQIPRIAKQRIDYLILSMKAFRDSTRPGADTAMSANVVGLSDADLTALAHYSASR